MLYLRLVLIICICSRPLVESTQEYCLQGDDSCGAKTSLVPKYILYDVNPPEGFNLRRDVYMRLAIFIHQFAKKAGDWHLVLPPWNHLFHWRSHDRSEQMLLPWSTFFDVKSMAMFAPVVEMSQFLKELGGTEIDTVHVLQHYKDAFSSEDWEWKDKWEPSECNPDITFLFSKRERAEGYSGWLWGIENLTAREVGCISFQGPASQLSQLLEHSAPARSVMIDHAEVVLHDRFGDELYWLCRRSMRFSADLIAEAEDFRANRLNSTDKADRTIRHPDWRLQEFGKREAKGGPYLAVHLRRRDFLVGRSTQVPSLESAADQIRHKLDDLGLDTVFIATDAPPRELVKLFDLLLDLNVVRYEPSEAVKERFGDGGVAIIDQIVCSHARFFIGTHESTFSFRIHEEREILGFKEDTTFNRFCGSDPDCSQPTRWTIVS